MSWADELPPMLRVMVDDLTPPYRYDDNQIRQLIVVAARLVAMDATFPVPFSANVVDLTILPDPTDEPRDENFLNLTAAKAAGTTSPRSRPRSRSPAPLPSPSPRPEGSPRGERSSSS